MELPRITVLSLVFCMAYLPIALTGDPVIVHGKIGETIQLECPSGKTDTSTTRAWYRGRFSETDGPDGVDMIYRGPATNTGPKYRDDMTLDEDTYTLSLKVHKDGSDNDFFTCVTESVPKEKFDVTQVLIFLQPEVTIKVDPQPDEFVNVTVTCTVASLYPNITEDQFTMRWSGQETHEDVFTGTPNDDGSMKYTLERSRNLTRADSGVMVECTVTPKQGFGNEHSANLTFDFDAPTTPPGSGASYLGATLGSVISGLCAAIIIVALGDSRNI